MQATTWVLEADTNQVNILWIEKNALRTNKAAQEFIRTIRLSERAGHYRANQFGYELPGFISREMLEVWLERVQVKNAPTPPTLLVGVGGDGERILPFTMWVEGDMFEALLQVGVPAGLVAEYEDSGLILATGTVHDMKWVWRAQELLALTPQAMYEVCCDVAALCTEQAALDLFRQSPSRDELVESICTLYPAQWLQRSADLLLVGEVSPTTQQWQWNRATLAKLPVAELTTYRRFVESGNQQVVLKLLGA